MYEDVKSKWNLEEKVPIEKLYEKVEQLEARVKVLEEENVETTNTLYEIMHSVNAVDARIDIVTENPWTEQFDNV
jgi:hypothetical protein